MGGVGEHGHERNRELLERWLRARSRGYDAHTIPRSAEIGSAVRDMREWDPEAYAILERCYLGKQADPRLPDRWRERVAKEGYEGRHKTRGEMFKLHHLQDARRFVLYALHIADEDKAKRRTKKRAMQPIA